MKRIEAIIRPGKLDALIDNLEDIGISGLNVAQVKGYGSQKGHAEEVYRGVRYRIRLRKKIKVETIAKDDKVDEIIEKIIECTQTGEVGDGKIFLSPVEDAVRIRTGEKGADAL
ncbi:MAG: P-II family nitrogen regulator [Halanaerobiaceae bacterium]